MPHRLLSFIVSLWHSLGGSKHGGIFFPVSHFVLCLLLLLLFLLLLLLLFIVVRFTGNLLPFVS